MKQAIATKDFDLMFGFNLIAKGSVIHYCIDTDQYNQPDIRITYSPRNGVHPGWGSRITSAEFNAHFKDITHQEALKEAAAEKAFFRSHPELNP